MITLLQDEKADLDEKLRVIHRERDDFRDNVKDMVEVKAKADKERLNFAMITKAKETKLDA